MGLATVACGAMPDNTAAAVVPVPVDTPILRPGGSDPEGVEPPSATLAKLGKVEPGTETPGTEIPATQAYGRWKVIDAAGSGSGQALVGRTLSFTEDSLGWVDASSSVEHGCADAVYHIALLAMQVKEAAPAFRPGWSKFRIPPGDVGPMHMWECGDADSVFGPANTSGSVFFPVGTDRLVMNWHDGAVLLLRKEDR